MNARCRTASLLLLLCLAACSKQENPPAPPPKAAATPARPRIQTVADLPAKLRDDCETFAKQLERNMHEGAVKPICDAFNRPAIADAICAGVRLPENRLNEFKSGLARGLGLSAANVAKVWTNGDAKFKHLVIFKGGPAARFRFASGDTGVAIIDLVLARDAQGRIGVVDFFNHAMGYDLVAQTQQIVAPMLAEMDKSFLERLIAEPNVKPEDLKTFGELPRKLSKRDFAGVIAGYKTLSPQLRDSLGATAIYISALQQSKDDQAYKAALQDAARRFKTASFQFMLVDAYVLDKQFDKATECLENFMQSLEQDAVLLTLKSLTQKQGGHISEARATLAEALKLEPDCVYAHAKGLDVLLAARDFAAVRDSMTFLEATGNYRFKGALTTPVWKEFKAAPESASWR